MTAENFCYWLKGIFEIQEAGWDKNEKRSIKLTEAQIEMINEHLNYVFQTTQRAGVTTDYSTSGSGASSILDRAISGSPLPGKRTTYMLTPLSEIKARLERATPGKWDYSENGVGYIYSDSEGGIRSYICEAILNNDVALIVHARTDIEKLVKALELAIEQRDKAIETFRMSGNYKTLNCEMIADHNAAIEACLRGEE